METTKTKTTPTLFAVIVKGYAYSINNEKNRDVVVYTANNPARALRLFKRLPMVLSWTDCGTAADGGYEKARAVAADMGLEKPWKFDGDR